MSLNENEHKVLLQSVERRWRLWVKSMHHVSQHGVVMWAISCNVRSYWSQSMGIPPPTSEGTLCSRDM
eukprot:6213138-Pleurochrysis_carterae.AAC.5